MEYKGKLYGKVNGVYFDTGKTSDDYDKLEAELNKLKNKKPRVVNKMFPSFWFMRCNHTFIKPIGDNIQEIMNEFKEIAKKNPHGMVCNVTRFRTLSIVGGAKELDRIGINVHVDGDGEVDLSSWYNSIKKYKVIKDFGI